MEEIKTSESSAGEGPVGVGESITGQQPKSDSTGPVPNEKESGFMKYLKKIGMGFVAFFVISPSATIQAFTYFFRGLADALVGLKRKGIKELPKAVGKFFFYLFTKPFVFFPYIFSAMVDWKRIIGATGEKGEEAKITTVCKYKAYNFSDKNNMPKAKTEDLSFFKILKIIFGVETTATKECPRVSDGTGKKEIEEKKSVVNKALRLYRETVGINLDKDGSIKPKSVNGFSIGPDDSSPFIL